MVSINPQDKNPSQPPNLVNQTSHEFVNSEDGIIKKAGENIFKASPIIDDYDPARLKSHQIEDLTYFNTSQMSAVDLTQDNPLLVSNILKGYEVSSVGELPLTVSSLLTSFVSLGDSISLSTLQKSFLLIDDGSIKERHHRYLETINSSISAAAAQLNDSKELKTNLLGMFSDEKIAKPAATQPSINIAGLNFNQISDQFIKDLDRSKSVEVNGKRVFSLEEKKDSTIEALCDIIRPMVEEIGPQSLKQIAILLHQATHVKTYIDLHILVANEEFFPNARKGDEFQITTDENLDLIQIEAKRLYQIKDFDLEANPGKYPDINDFKNNAGEIDSTVGYFFISKLITCSKSELENHKAGEEFPSFEVKQIITPVTQEMSQAYKEYEESKEKQWGEDIIQPNKVITPVKNARSADVEKVAVLPADEMTTPLIESVTNPILDEGSETSQKLSQEPAFILSNNNGGIVEDLEVAVDSDSETDSLSEDSDSETIIPESTPQGEEISENGMRSRQNQLESPKSTHIPKSTEESTSNSIVQMLTNCFRFWTHFRRNKD